MDTGLHCVQMIVFFVVDESIGLHYEDHTLENWMDIVLFCNQKNKELNKNTDL